MSGGGAASSLLHKAVELTEDEQWHDYREIMAELCKLIPPGRAIRRAEGDRLKSGGPVERAKNADTSQIIAIGQRAIARDVLVKPAFEVKPIGKVPAGVPKHIRLVQVPPRIITERRLAEENRLMRPEVMMTTLLSGADATELLRDMTHKQLIRLIEAMVVELSPKDEESEYVPAPHKSGEELQQSVRLRTGIRDRAREILKDRQWHDFEHVLAELGQDVSVQAALAKAEDNRVKSSRTASRKLRVEKHDLDRLIQIGRRAIAREALRDNGVVQRTFEVVPPGLAGRAPERQNRKIRLIEGDHARGRNGDEPAAISHDQDLAAGHSAGGEESEHLDGSGGRGDHGSGAS